MMNGLPYQSSQPSLNPLAAALLQGGPPNQQGPMLGQGGPQGMPSLPPSFSGAVQSGANPIGSPLNQFGTPPPSLGAGMPPHPMMGMPMQSPMLPGAPMPNGAAQGMPPRPFGFGGYGS